MKEEELDDAASQPKLANVGRIFDIGYFNPPASETGIFFGKIYTPNNSGNGFWKMVNIVIEAAPIAPAQNIARKIRCMMSTLKLEKTIQTCNSLPPSPPSIPTNHAVAAVFLFSIIFHYYVFFFSPFSN